MIYIYFILGTFCLILSGMWFGTICQSYYDKLKISITQYFMFGVTFSTGLFQFILAIQLVML
jgi:hypothetical protein